MNVGEYYHFGLQKGVEALLKHRDTIRNASKNISLLINIDGLPLSKNMDGLVFWPILCSDNVSKCVYIVGCFCGQDKPTNANEFLRPFVDEAINLSRNGYIYNGAHYNVKISALICDTPAAAFVLSIKHHTGFNSCRKCTIRGQWVQSKVCFVEKGTQSALRTDEEFAKQKYESHQIGETILKEIPNFGLVSGVPLDYMHLICLGVMKKLIWLWLKGPLSIRIGSIGIREISKTLTSLKKTAPNDFVRKPRSLKHALQWKATEYRNFILYTGPVALQKVLREDMYFNFLTLHVAITILVSPTLSLNYRDYAHSLLQHFVTSFSIIYGKQYVTYNIHNVLHLCADVRKYGPLDMFSAFRFENYMSCIKRHLRKKEKPLQQLARRYEENQAQDNLSNGEYVLHNNVLCLKKIHNDGPVFERLNIKHQYKICLNESYSIRCDDKRNNALLLKDGTAIRVYNIIESQNSTVYIIGKKMLPVADLYSVPLRSRTFKIAIVTEDTKLRVYCLSQLAGKLWIMQYKHKSIIFPIIHTV